MHEVSFTLRNTTKGTVRYSENGKKDEHVVGTLYVKKSAFPGEEYPEHITVTLNLGTVEEVEVEEEAA